MNYYLNIPNIIIQINYYLHKSYLLLIILINQNKIIYIHYKFYFNNK
jgi:hypothetical protein